MRLFLPSLRLLLVLTALTGVAYPLAVWAVARVAFPHQASGSLVRSPTGDGVIGSTLLAQKFTAPGYIWSRPSAGDFATVPSGASHHSWTSAALAAAVAERRTALGLPPDAPTGAPADLLTASGSGLDPHLSPAAVRAQLPRVTAARALRSAQAQQLDALVTAHTEGGGLTPARVNVLHLNLALDAAFPQ